MTKRTTILVLGIALLLTGLLAGCGSRWLAGGKLHFDQQRYDKALENFELAVQEQPENGEARLWHGRALAELERDGEASEEIRKAFELDPLQEEMVNNTLASYWSKRFNSGMGYAQEGDEARRMGEEERAVERLKLAVDRFERAMLYCPDSVKNYINLGKVFYQLGRQDESMSMFDEAHERVADRPQMQDLLFRVYTSVAAEALRADTREGYEQAIELFHKALAYERPAQDLSDVYFNIAVGHAALSDIVDPAEKPEHLKQSEEHYLKVLEINPQDADALQNLAYVYADAGEKEKSLEAGQRLLDLEPWNPDYYFVMVRLHNAAGERELSTGYMMIRESLTREEPSSGYDARSEATGYGPRNDMLITLRERGEPEMVYVYSGSRGDYDIWCYWTEGRIYIFKEGHEAFRAAFAGMSPEQMEEAFGGGGGSE